MMRIGRLGAFFCAALAVVGCKPSQQVYPVSLAEAHARLDNADLIGFRNARQCGLLIHLIRLLPVGDSITWLVRSSEQNLAKFTVSLTQAENGVQASIDVPKADDGGELYDGKQNYSHPALKQPLRPSVREMIDAAMEKRPFDARRLPDPLVMGPAKTMNNCSMGEQLLERGIPMSLNDPEGMPHDVWEKTRFGR